MVEHLRFYQRCDTPRPHHGGGCPSASPASLNPTAVIVALLHKQHITHAWRDHATAFCWEQIARLTWTEPVQARAVCEFLHHVPDQRRAQQELSRLTPMIRAVIENNPTAAGNPHTPLYLAPHPGHIARQLFDDAAIEAHLDTLAAAQCSDGGWPITWESWSVAADAEWRGIRTLTSLLTLRAYGRLQD